jgi:hypothetical protein
VPAGPEGRLGSTFSILEVPFKEEVSVQRLTTASESWPLRAFELSLSHGEFGKHCEIRHCAEYRKHLRPRIREGFGNRLMKKLSRHVEGESALI